MGNDNTILANENITLGNEKITYFGMFNLISVVEDIFIIRGLSVCTSAHQKEVLEEGFYCIALFSLFLMSLMLIVLWLMYILTI